MTSTIDQIASQSRIVAAPTSLKPGLYFNLDEDAYHGDPALGSGSVRALAKCPIYYWTESWMNPFRVKDTDTAALLFGRALHKLVLEGGVAFEHGFAREPQEADHPGALVLIPHIKAALKARGAKGYSTMNKPELILMLKGIDPTVVIFDDIMAAFESECRQNRRSILKPAIYDQVVVAAAFIANDERVRAAFQGGRSEVSVVWEHNGVPLKARFDHMRLGKNSKGDRIGLITDLKSFANVMEAPPERAVIQAIANTRLDIQAASYLKAAAKVGEYIKSGQVYGAEGVSTEWLDAFTALEPTDWQFFWVFYQKNAPVSLLRMTEPQSPMIEAANMEFARAIEAYKDNMQAFGTNWKFVDPMPDPRIDASDLPKWLIGA